MTEKKKELYHCDRCGELFSALVVPADQVICNLCGSSPVKAIRSNLDHEEMKTGELELEVRRMQDQADFVGMKRLKRKKQMYWAVLAWVLLLGVGGGVAVYYKNKQEDLSAKVAKEQKQKDYEMFLFFQRQDEAVTAAEKLINLFVLAPDVNTRSLFVVNGVQQLIAMDGYYNSQPPLLVTESLKIHRVSLKEDGPQPVLETILKDGDGKEVEVVFVKDQKEKKWKIDWKHFVRYNEKSWNRFLLSKEEGSSAQFRLYVRQRAGSLYVPSHDDQNIEDDSSMYLIFYEPKIFDGARGVESPEVEVNRYTKSGKLFIQAFKDAKEAKENLKEGEQAVEQLLGGFDAPGLARVHVELQWVKEGGEMKLVVRKILALNWLTLQN